jgi:hypothetical protein
MPRYHLNLFNGTGSVIDEEGLEFPDLAAARAEAVRDIRSILSDEVLKGRIDLQGRIEIAEPAGTVCATVRFTEAVELILAGKGE